MARLLVPFTLGIATSILGFVLLITGMNGDSTMLIWPGFALFIGVGPVLCLVGLVLYAGRPPTATELTRQRLDDMRTWQFKPAGLALFVGLLAIVSGLTVAAEAHWGVRLHGFGGRGFGMLLALPIFGLLGLRRVRRLIFHVEDSSVPPGELPRTSQHVVRQEQSQTTDSVGSGDLS
jgi:hypothetical protein